MHYDSVARGHSLLSSLYLLAATAKDIAEGVKHAILFHFTHVRTRTPFSSRVVATSCMLRSPLQHLHPFGSRCLHKLFNNTTGRVLGAIENLTPIKPETGKPDALDALKPIRKIKLHKEPQQRWGTYTANFEAFLAPQQRANNSSRCCSLFSNSACPPTWTSHLRAAVVVLLLCAQ
jgi:hypothetical protein